MKSYLVQILSLALCLLAVNARDCTVRVRGGSMTAPTPLILETNVAEFVIPNKRSAVVVKNGKSIQLWCSDSFSNYNAQLLTATCQGGENFLVNGETQTFASFAVCKSWPRATAEATGVSCTNGEIIRVGFRISSSRFVEQMQICFDKQLETTHYVQYTLGPYSKYFQTNVDRVNFEQLDYFGNKNIERLYTKRMQISTISKELNQNANRYFDSANYLFLARGHLAAKADFVYGAQQQATFMYINVAPQWQIVNAGNWGDVEIAVRELSNMRGSNLNCYTGTYSVTTLPNNKGVQTPIYLSDNKQKQIPVPKLYYRIVIEESTNLGVVLITVNNPHKTYAELKNEYYILCNDVSDQLSYLDLPQRTNLNAGYTYACTVSEFLKHVTDLPPLSVSGLLA